MTKAEAEIDWLKLENERLHQVIQKMALSVPNHKGLQEKSLHDSKDFLHPLRSFKPEFVPHSVHVDELTDRLEQTETKLQHTEIELQHAQTELQHTLSELQQTKGELKQLQEKVYIIFP